MRSSDDSSKSGSKGQVGSGACADDQALSVDEEAAGLAPDVLDLLHRSTELRRGLAFVSNGPIDCVASALGVHPAVVDRTRECLDQAAERKLVLKEYAKARETQRPSAPPPPVEQPKVLAPEDVIREAHAHPLGLDFLLYAPLETTAITFAVHPDVVVLARGLLATRGIVPEQP